MPLEMETAAAPEAAHKGASARMGNRSLGHTDDGPIRSHSNSRSRGRADGHSRSHNHNHNHSQSRSLDRADDDSVVGLGVPHGDGDVDAAAFMQREEEFMDEMIMKHRSDFQHFVARTMDVNVAATTAATPTIQDNLQNIPPPSHPSASPSASPSSASPSRTSTPTRASRPRFDPNFRTPQPPKRGSASERLSHLSRTERTDRMAIAELSDVRNEQLARDAIRRWNPHAKEAAAADRRARHGLKTRERALTSPPLATTTARMLGEFSKDYVQQAIDFTHHDLLTDDDDDDDRVGGGDDDDEDLEDDDDGDDDELGPPLQNELDDLIDHQLRGPLSTKKMRKYVKHVKHMETTIAQLVLQKEELLRNQAEFDKHASGMFPTLENLNNQLSQIVQDRLLQSQVNIKDDVEGELRGLRVRLNELEAEARQRRNDGELREQKSEMEIGRLITEVASLGATGDLQDQRMELLTSQIKQLQHEIHQSLEVTRSVSSQYQSIDKRITTIQMSLNETRALAIGPHKGSRGNRTWIALVVLAIALFFGLLATDRCSRWFGRCRPLT